MVVEACNLQGDGNVDAIQWLVECCWLGVNGTVEVFLKHLLC